MQTPPSPRRDSNADHGRPGVDAHLNVLHRAPEPNAKDASPAIHAADERSKQETNEPLRTGRATLRALQLRQDSPDAKMYASDSSRID